MKYTRPILITLTVLGIFGLLFCITKCFHKKTEKEIVWEECTLGKEKISTEKWKFDLSKKYNETTKILTYRWCLQVKKDKQPWENGKIQDFNNLLKETRKNKETMDFVLEVMDQVAKICQTPIQIETQNKKGDPFTEVGCQYSMKEIGGTFCIEIKGKVEKVENKKSSHSYSSLDNTYDQYFEEANSHNKGKIQAIVITSKSKTLLTIPAKQPKQPKKNKDNVTYNPAENPYYYFDSSTDQKARKSFIFLWSYVANEFLVKNNQPTEYCYHDKYYNKTVERMHLRTIIPNSKEFEKEKLYLFTDGIHIFDEKGNPVKDKNGEVIKLTS